MDTKLYVAFDGDGIGQQVGRARLDNDVEGIRRISQAIDRGNAVWAGWAMSYGGSTIEVGGDEGLLEVPARALEQLEQVRHAYETAVGAPCSVGLGKKVSEASKALLAAKLRGKNRVVFYDQQVEQEVAAAAEHPQTEGEKIGEEYLTKADGDEYAISHKKGREKGRPVIHVYAHCGDAPVGYALLHYLPGGAELQGSKVHVDEAHRRRGLASRMFAHAEKATGRRIESYNHLSEDGKVFWDASFGTKFGKIELLTKDEPRTEGSAGPAKHAHRGYKGPAAPSRQTEEHSQGEVAVKQAVAPRPDPVPGQPFEAHFRAAADAQDKRDRVTAARKSGDLQKLKEQVAMALDGVRTQLPVLQQLKSAYPDAFKSVLNLVQGVISLGRELQTADDQLAKHEKAPKVWRSAGWGLDAVSIPSVDHPQRKDFDAKYHAAVAEQMANGDSRAVRPLTVKVDELEGGNSRGIVNPDRYRLYRRMLRAGDKVPPVVVQRAGDRWRLLDGTHRHIAARDEGVTELPALELRAMRKAEPRHDLLPGGAADRLRPEDFDPDALALGTAREMEHTSDEALAREIAMDHLLEDPDYYTREMKQELEPAAPPPPETVLDKKQLSATQKARRAHTHAHRSTPLPVGTQHAGEVKVTHADGKTGWKGVRAGMIQGQEPGVPLLGANSHPVSSREPGAK